jgi:N-acetylneuraminate synthase/N,N'-diacetyllegionaminate synthase
VPSLEFGDKVIDAHSPVFVIAEAGINHNGSVDMAMRMIDVAAEAGVDCVKFQTYRTENLLTSAAPKANYQLKTTNRDQSQYEMLKKVELTTDDFEKLMTHCLEREVVFLSTPYNMIDVDTLDELGVSGFKIASGQLVEPPFLEYVADKGKPIILSTGMGYMSDVAEAVRVFRESKNNHYALLHCVTDYPSKLEDSNILAMKMMSDLFQCVVGYSDHTENDISVLASIALGGKIVEKHFTLDNEMSGPDHSCSVPAPQLKQFVSNIRMMESSLGNGVKEPTPNETLNSVDMRRSLVLQKQVASGQVLTQSDIGFKRPGTGLSPALFSMFLGKKLLNSQSSDTMLSFDMVEWDVNKRN